MNKRKIKLALFIIFVVISVITTVKAATIYTTKSTLNINETIIITVDFGQNIAAYDDLKLNYNKYALQYISDEPLEEKWWYDDTKEQKGIRNKTYTFKAIGNGISDITFEAKGVTSANMTLDYLGDISIKKTITTGKGYTKGDSNCDGKVNSSDATIILDMYTSNSPLDSDYLVNDINGDGKINGTDAALVLDMYKGM